MASPANFPFPPRARSPPAQVYLAGAFNNKEKLRKIVLGLQHARCELVSRWMDRETPSPEHRQECADQDLQAIRKCDFLVAIMDHLEYLYCGTFTEIGFALGVGKTVIILCPGTLRPHKQWGDFLCQTNPFLWASHIHRVSTVHDLLSFFHGG